MRHFEFWAIYFSAQLSKNGQLAMTNQMNKPFLFFFFGERMHKPFQFTAYINNDDSDNSCFTILPLLLSIKLRCCEIINLFDYALGEN